MKILNLSYMMGMIILASRSGAISADTDIKTATTSGTDEADIKAYVDLSMQGWQNPADFTDSYSTPDDINEPPADVP